MAKQIIWSPLAKQKRKEILEYWIEHNQSKSFQIWDLLKIPQKGFEVIILALFDTRQHPKKKPR